VARTIPGVALVMAVGSVLTASAAEFKVQGRVADESGKPVAGASVCALETAFPWDQIVQDVVTEEMADKSGQFVLTLKDAPGRGCIIAARHPDYGLIWNRAPSNAADTTGSHLYLTMPKRIPIQGKVTDLKGEPIVNALVLPALALRTGDPILDPPYLVSCEKLLSARTGPDGRFVVHGIPAGATGVLKVIHPEFAIAVRGFGKVGPDWPIGSIQIDGSDIEVALQPPATIEGKVTAEGTGEPVSGVTVDASPDLRGTDPRIAALIDLALIPLREVTDGRGHYAIRGLPQGTYRLRVEHPDWAPMVKEPIFLPPGTATINGDIVLSKGVLVSGKVVMTDTGAPVTDGRVAIHRELERLSQSSRTDENGRFQVRFTPGNAVLVADVLSSGFIPYGERQRSLTLAAGQDVTDIVFRVKPTIKFKGTVLGPDSKPLPGALVFATDARHVQVTTSSDGTFELPLMGWEPAEQKFVAVEARHPDLPEHRGVVGKQFSGEGTAEGVIDLKRTGRVTGRVVDESGKPIKGANVTALQHYGLNREGATFGPYYDSGATCNESGRYEFKSIASGIVYTVEATAPTYGIDRGQPFSVNENEQYHVPDLILPLANMSIEGTVTDDDGKPVAGGTVTCFGQATPPRFTTTDAQGRYRFDHLVNEQLFLSARSRIDSPLSGSAMARAGADHADIILAEGGRSTPEQRRARELTGKLAPDLDAATWVNCQPVTLSAFRGKTVVLAFWDSADKSREGFVPFLNALLSKRQGSNIEIVSIHSAGAEIAALKQFVSGHGIKFPVAVDKLATNKIYRGATFERYNIKTVPSVFIIDAEGKVRYQDVPLRAVEEALKATLGEK